MLKAEQVDFEIRLWPLLKGDLVLPQPGAAQARDRDREGRQRSAELGAGRGAGGCRGGQGGGRARQPLRDAADRPARSHRRQAQLPRSQAQARPRRHGLDGDRPGRRPAAGRVAAQRQARGPAAHPALRRRLDRHAARHRAALSAWTSTSPSAPPSSRPRARCMDPFQWTGADVAALAVGPRPRRHLSAARHPRPAHAALQHQRQAASRVRRLEVRPEQVACRRQRSHRRRLRSTNAASPAI